jgi:hypothetical protein
VSIREALGDNDDSVMSANPNPIRIFTVDDHPLFRNGIAALLATQPDMSLVAEASNENVLQSGRDGHWGLIGMRESAEKIGARLKLCSSIGAGTELVLTVPGHIAFAKRRGGLVSRWAGWRFWKKQKAAARVASGAED